MKLVIALLIGIYAVAASLGFLVVTGSHIVGCLGLYPEQNEACQAAAVARLPWFDQFLGTPVPWVLAFVAASTVTVILARRRRLHGDVDRAA